MGLIRGVTVSVLIVFAFVASASFAFVYLVSGYPSPEVEAFDLDRNGNVSAEVVVVNRGGEGDVVVDFRVLDASGSVTGSRSREFYMGRDEARTLVEEFEASGEDVEVAVFAPGRPELIQDREEFMERLPEPDDFGDTS